MKSNRYRTLDREYLLEQIQEEELRMKSKKRRRVKKKKYKFTGRFWVIVSIATMLFFAWIAPIMN